MRTPLTRLCLLDRFLHASLQMEMLRRCLNVRQIREYLSRFPTKIEELYATTMKRIDMLGEEDAELARLILLWLLYAARPLSITELQYAVAVRPGTYEIDEDSLVDVAFLVSICCGVITIHQKSGSVRLIRKPCRDSPLMR